MLPNTLPVPVRAAPLSNESVPLTCCPDCVSCHVSRPGPDGSAAYRRTFRSMSPGSPGSDGDGDLLHADNPASPSRKSAPRRRPARICRSTHTASFRQSVVLYSVCPSLGISSLSLHSSPPSRSCAMAHRRKRVPSVRCSGSLPVRSSTPTQLFAISIGTSSGTPSGDHGRRISGHAESADRSVCVRAHQRVVPDASRPLSGRRSYHARLSMETGDRAAGLADGSHAAAIDVRHSERT